MFCGPGCPHWATGPMILIHIRYIRSHLKPLSGQVYKCVWAPWAKINSFQVGWDVVFHAVALASCVLVEDGKSNTTSRNHEWCQCETVTKREFLRAQFGIVVCCCWSYIFGLVSPGFQIFLGISLWQPQPPHLPLQFSQRTCILVNSEEFLCS